MGRLKTLGVLRRFEMNLISQSFRFVAFGSLVLVSALTTNAAQAMPQAPQTKPGNLGNSANIGTLEVTPETKSGLAPAPTTTSASVITLPEQTGEFAPLERALNNLVGRPDRSIKPALFDNRPNTVPGFIRTDL